MYAMSINPHSNFETEHLFKFSHQLFPLSYPQISTTTDNMNRASHRLNRSLGTARTTMVADRSAMFLAHSHTSPLNQSATRNGSTTTKERLVILPDKPGVVCTTFPFKLPAQNQTYHHYAARVMREQKNHNTNHRRYDLITPSLPNASSSVPSTHRTLSVSTTKVTCHGLVSLFTILLLLSSFPLLT